MLGRMGTGEVYYFIARASSDIKTKTKGCLLNKEGYICLRRFIGDRPGS